MAASIALPLASSLVLHPIATRVQRSSVRMDAISTEDQACYLFDSDEGTKYVCTSNPEELAVRCLARAARLLHTPDNILHRREH